MARLDAFRNRLRASLNKVMKEEQAFTEQRLSVPVVYGVGGEVIERSAPGEPPRTETGELMGNVYGEATLHSDYIEGTLTVQRPSTPDVPQLLEVGLNRPILDDAQDGPGSITNRRQDGAARIAKHFRSGG
jgi:hypothetical protein